MKRVNIFFKFIYNIELYCAYCFYQNLHLGHKVLPINEEELLKKENISIENSTKTFNENTEKLTILKTKIEKEIAEIDKLYEKVNNEVTKSYELKHEKLNKDENDLKDKLQNEVTKVKEQLEKFLSQTSNLIKTCEKINKGIKALEKEEKNMIKTLSYVSKMNKNQKEMMLLFQQLMKNLKINFKEEESNITYEEYFFNGIQTPKDIEFKEIGTNSFKLFWKIDDINILNLDNKQIKFKVEIKMDDENDKFLKAYEGNDSNCFIDNLNKNTNYQIRICTIYIDLVSIWTEKQKLKTKYFDSIILGESEREIEFLEKIFEWSGYKKMELIYRGTRDGMNSNIFHNKCDNQGPTICLFKNEKGYIFGGYASISWTTNTGYRSASDCFLFTLTNIHGTSPTKFQNTNSNLSVFHHSSHGPTFGGGHDIYIPKDFMNGSPYCNFPHSYQDNLGKGKSIFTGDLNNNNQSLKLKEIEVFKLFK